ncbi:MAG: helix-turn-helix domain-containing protein [Patescibacteria group bacterium]
MNKKIYKELGDRIREHRKKLNIGIKAAARQLDIDFSYLSKVENGLERPSKDLLNRLIFNYQLQEKQASELFHLAEYREGVITVDRENNENNSKEQTITIPAGTQTLYSDVVSVTASPHGIVLNFAQQLGPTNQFVVVSRIGMSKEHVRSLIRVLEGLMEKTTGKKATRKISFD